MWRSLDNEWEMVFTFCHMGSEIKLRFSGLSKALLPAEPCRWPGRCRAFGRGPFRTLCMEAHLLITSHNCQLFLSPEEERALSVPTVVVQWKLV